MADAFDTVSPINEKPALSKDPGKAGAVSGVQFDKGKEMPGFKRPDYVPSGPKIKAKGS